MTEATENYTADEYFAAVKIIEQLYKTDNISGVIYGNILREYSDVIDTTKFTEIDPDKEETLT